MRDNKTKMHLERYVDLIALILKIERPVIRYDKDKVQSEGKFAWFSGLDENILYLREDKEFFTVSELFDVAYVMREIWHIPVLVMNSLSVPDLDPDVVKSCNDQWAKVDASAFGLVMMDYYFGETVPLFGCSAQQREEIQERAELLYPDIIERLEEENMEI